MKLSVVIPVYNEEDNLRLLHARLADVLTSNSDDHEMIFVDDGSRDGSLGIIQELCRTDPHVRCISFSRNFGHEIASTAGLDRATGDGVVLIDADLQDPPEVIADLVSRWKDGADVAYARRRRRQDESLFRKCAAWSFYRVLGWFSEVDIPPDTGDFRLMDRRVVEVVKQCRENPRFVRGLVSWAGFRQDEVLYDRAGRHAGESKYDTFKLLRLSWEVICAYSLTPLRLATWIGLPVTILSLSATVVAGVLTAAGIAAFSPTLWLLCGLFVLGGMGLTAIGVLGHYVGQVLKCSQGRPLYVVAHEDGWSQNPSEDPVTVRRSAVGGKTHSANPSQRSDPLKTLS